MGWREVEAMVAVGVRDTFGEDDLVSYQHLSGAGPPAPFRAPFSEYYTQVDSETKLKLVSRQPNLLVRDADLTEAPRDGDRFTFRGAVFAVEEARIDGTGSTLLLSRRV